MHHTALRHLALPLALLFAVGVAATAAPDRLAAQAPPRQAAAEAPAAKAEKPSQSGKSEQAIVLLVNDEPITAYEIQQRANFLVLQGSAGLTPELKAKAEARWAQITKDPKINERLNAMMRERKVATQEQAQLIDERLKLQEAKRGGIEITDADVRRMMKTLADRNKMTEDQFAQHLKGMGVDIATMNERTRAQAAWREVVRRKFSAQISITSRDVDRMISATASETGADTVELQVQKIILPTPGKMDQAALAKRYAEADGLRQRIGGCNAMGGLAKEVNARFDDLKYI